MLTGRGVVGVVDKSSTAVGAGNDQRALCLLVIPIHREERQTGAQSVLRQVKLPAQLKAHQRFLVEDSQGGDAGLILLRQGVDTGE